MCCSKLLFGIRIRLLVPRNLQLDQEIGEAFAQDFFFQVMDDKNKTISLPPNVINILISICVRT